MRNKEKTNSVSTRLHQNKKQQFCLSKFVSCIEPVKQWLYLSPFEESGVEIDIKCINYCGLALALFLQSDESFLSTTVP